MNIFVGNLSNMTTTSHLAALFVPFGEVLSVKIFRDVLSGRSLGFGHIKMNSRSGAMAIEQLNCLNFMNHYLEINEAGL